MSLHCQRNTQKRIKIYDLLMALLSAAVLSQRHFPELPSRGQTVLVTWSCRIMAPDSAALLLQHCQAFKAAAQCLDESSRSSPWSQQTLGFESSTCKKTWTFPPVQFLSCSPHAAQIHSCSCLLCVLQAASSWLHNSQYPTWPSNPCLLCRLPLTFMKIWHHFKAVAFEKVF